MEYTSESLARGYATSWPAEIAAFTNLTHDHLDAHREPEHYLASKAQLFAQCSKIPGRLRRFGRRGSAVARR